jgi:hypothetical protein
MQTQDILLTIFTGVLAVAVLMQTLIFFGIYKSIRRLTEWMDGMGKDLRKNMEIVTSKVDESLSSIKEITDGFKPIKDRLVDTTELIHNRIVDVDDFLAETTRTARMEVLKMQARIESASNRVEEILELAHDSVMAPLNEIGALTRGIRAGFDLLFRRRRNPSSTAPQDEEMFI